MAQLILADLSNAAEQADTNEPNLTKITAIEAELAAKAASSARPEKCRAVLEGIVATEKFQTPAVLYAAGSAFSHFEPERAVELLIKASSLQQRHKSSRLDIEPGQIAEEAARLACELFEQSADNCPLTVTAFDNCTKSPPTISTHSSNTSTPPSSIPAATAKELKSSFRKSQTDPPAQNATSPDLS